MKRKVARDEVTFVQGLPVTRPERIVFDLVLDDEDLSLVADVLREAAYVNREFLILKIWQIICVITILLARPRKYTRSACRCRVTQ